MAIAAAGDTWGISAPDFLVGYLILIVVGMFATIRRRKQLADPGQRLIPNLVDHPHDVAYLNGGADLAVMSALSSLRLQQLVHAQRGIITSTGWQGRDTFAEIVPDPLERALHVAAITPTHRSRLPYARPVRATLDDIAARLCTAGLLLTPAQRTRIRLVGLWTAAIAALGFLRIVSGIANAKPIGYVTFLFLLTAIVAVVQLCTAPRRTTTGGRTLTSLRAQTDRYAPQHRPDWTVYGPAAAALSIGLFGAGALWASDPAMAEELAAQKASSGADGGSSGGDGGSSCGGGGCGGGCGG